MAGGQLFVSYRRSQAGQVAPLAEALRAAGIEVFFDQDGIDPLAPFPDRISTAIAESHALLAWWSADFGESDHCLHEFRLAWQHARKLGSDLHNRLWVLNPESGVGHVAAGELDAQNFLAAPGDDAARTTLARRLKAKLDALLAPGPLACERGAQAAPPLHGVPLGNPMFTGRNGELMRIHSLAHPPRIGAAARDVAVQTHGMGGIGKTELALHYARAFADAYPGGVFWLNLAGFDPERLPEASLDAAADEAWFAALEAGLEKASDLRGRLRDAEDRPLPVGAVRSLLAEQLGDQPSLWVLDNVPTVTREDLRERMLGRWPGPGATSRRLVTTRDARPMPGFAPLKLAVLSIEDAQRLLARYLKPANAAEHAAIADLADELGRHPQALALLGTRVAMDGRADAWARAREAIAEKGALPQIEAIAAALGPTLGAKARGIVASLALSIAPLSPPAQLILLHTAACPAGLPIPREILFAAFPEELGNPVDALAPLLRHSLLGTRNGAESHCVDIHSLVAETAWHLLVPAEANAVVLRQTIEQRVANLLGGKLQTTGADRTSRDSNRPAATLAAALYSLLDGEAAVHLGFSLASFHTADANYAATRTLLEIVLGHARQVLGDEHAATLSSMNNLALALHAQGDLSGARALHESVLATQRRMLGDEHPDTLRSMNNLAGTLQAQGDFARARALQESVLAVQRRVLGDEHPDTLRSMNNLAGTLQGQGDFARARALQESVLAVQRRVLGEEHPDTLTSMNNLAGTLQAQGELAGARALHESVLATLRRVLGEEHPDTLSSMNNLANTLQAQGDLAGARALHESELAICRRVLGEEHPDTLISMNNLASNLQRLGDLAGARALHESELAICRRVLGEEHPDTLSSMNNLASTLRAQGDLAGARALHESALATRRRVLGKEHPDTLRSMNNLAATLHAQGELAGALALLESVLTIQRRVLGEEHPGTLTSMNNLASTFQAQGNLARARALHESALATWRRVLGEEHPDTLSSMNNVASTLRAQGDLAGARALQESVFAIQRRVLGEEHPHTLNSAAWVADGLWHAGEHEAATAQMRAAAEGLARALGPNHPNTLAVRQAAGKMQAAINQSKSSQPLWRRLV